MSLIWWILPALAGVVGLMLLFGGFSRMTKMQPASGAVRMLFGVGFLGLAGIIAFAGLNLQTYKRLTYERDVANIKFAAVPGEPDAYVADVTFADGTKLTEREGGAAPVLRGDQFEIGAQVIKFQAMANMLGYDSIYRLEFIEGRNANRYNTAKVTEAVSNGLKLSDNPGLDVHALAKQEGQNFGVDAQYGSATYQPMGDGFEYNVSITQDALVARPTTATQAKIELGDYPGFSSGAAKKKDPQ
jgi:hypothetical protein